MPAALLADIIPELIEVEALYVLDGMHDYKRWSGKYQECTETASLVEVEVGLDVQEILEDGVLFHGADVGVVFGVLVAVRHVGLGHEDAVSCEIQHVVEHCVLLALHVGAIVVQSCENLALGLFLDLHQALLRLNFLRMEVLVGHLALEIVDDGIELRWLEGLCPDLHLFHEGVDPVLDHVLRPHSLHELGDEGPLVAVLADLQEELKILCGIPAALRDVWVDVVDPELPAVAGGVELGATAELKQLKRDPLPPHDALLLAAAFLVVPHKILEVLDVLLRPLHPEAVR